MLGISGAHRSGKTTLAHAFAEKMGMPYVSISTVEVMKEMGYTSTDLGNFAERLKLQRRLVEVCDRVFQGRKTPFVSDRTPIDVAAYLLCDVRQDLPADQARQAVEIVEDCIDITNACFGGVITIEPWLQYQPEPGKPAPNSIFQWQHHYACVGLLTDARIRVPFWSFTKGLLDLEERVGMVGEIYGAIIDDDVSVSSVSLHH